MFFQQSLFYTNIVTISWKLITKKGLALQSTARSILLTVKFGRKEEAELNKIFTFLGKPRTINHQIANRKVSWLELFYDLIFAVVIARLTDSLLENLTITSIGYSVLIFGWFIGAGMRYQAILIIMEMTQLLTCSLLIQK